MQGKLSAAVKGLFQTRDELSLGNIRKDIWPLILIFPLTVILGDLRYFNLHYIAFGLESYELMLFPIGLGWLVIAASPKRLAIPFLCLAALASAILLPFQIFSSAGMGQLALFMAFQFCGGVCLASAFGIFCFELNNVERLFGMALSQTYFGFYYTLWRAFPAVEAAGKSWGAAIVMALYLLVVFACARTLGRLSKSLHKDSQSLTSPGNCEGTGDSAPGGAASAVPFAAALGFVYYIIMCMINYVEGAEHSVSSLVFGIGAFCSVVTIIIVQLLNNRSALYIWLLFLALSLLGLGAILYDSAATVIFGSFAYGLGEGLGYIIIYYISGAVIKRSKSYRMFRFYCFMFFVEYFAVSGMFSLLFSHFHAPNKILAFGIVLVLGSFCLILMPLMQKKLFDIDWTDGLCLRDMAEYNQRLSETEVINSKDELNLTSREQEIFTMLLAGTAPKEIAYTLKISYNTVLFHQKNLYIKLGIQSRAELFAKYSSGG